MCFFGSNTSLYSSYSPFAQYAHFSYITIVLLIWLYVIRTLSLIFGGGKEMDWTKLCWSTIPKESEKCREKKSELTAIYAFAWLSVVLLLARIPKISAEKSIFLFIMTWIKYGLSEMRNACHRYDSFHSPNGCLTLHRHRCLAVWVSLSLPGRVDMVSLKINSSEIHFQTSLKLSTVGWKMYTKLFGAWKMKFSYPKNMIEIYFHENFSVVSFGRVLFFFFSLCISPISNWNEIINFTYWM